MFLKIGDKVKVIATKRELNKIGVHSDMIGEMAKIIGVDERNNEIHTNRDYWFYPNMLKLIERDCNE